MSRCPEPCVRGFVNSRLGRPDAQQACDGGGQCGSARLGTGGGSDSPDAGGARRPHAQLFGGLYRRGSEILT